MVTDVCMVGGGGQMHLKRGSNVASVRLQEEADYLEV
jgi:hypothetical protein